MSSVNYLVELNKRMLLEINVPDINSLFKLASKLEEKKQKLGKEYSSLGLMLQ